MPIISSILFAISASLDAFIVGISYGIKKVQITFLQNMVISLITLAGTVLSIAIGQNLAPLLPLSLAKVAGSILLFLLGFYYLLKFMKYTLKKYLSDRFQSSKDSLISAEEKAAHSLSMRETAFLGFTLSVNNIGIGIGASIAGLGLISAALITLLFSVSFLALGCHLGKAKLFSPAESYGDLISGFLLISLGIFELFT